VRRSRTRPGLRATGWRATTLAASDRKESTRSLYANLCRRHLEPAPFGVIPLDRLRPSDVEAVVLRMRAKTKQRGQGDDAKTVRALSDSTIRTTASALASCRVSPHLRCLGSSFGFGLSCHDRTASCRSAACYPRDIAPRE
jgi:hypothetical protein